MPSEYIQFVKMNPQLPNESPKERIKRVAALWREFKAASQGGQQYMTGFIPHHQRYPQYYQY